MVATSALGMGYDKADLTFVVHFQAPGSVVSYYQQVGRAGRGVDHADVVLLRGGEDRRIQDFFIEQAFPARERVRAVLDELETADGDGRTTRELMSVVNLGMGRIEAMLKILDVEGAVRRAGNRWQAVADTDWSYDAERYAQVTALRRAEQTAMAAYGTDGRCLMRVLQEELDDPDPRDCGRCSVCTGPRFAQPPAAELVERAQRHLRSRPIELEVRKMAPDADGTMRKIPRTRVPSRAGHSPGWETAAGGRPSSVGCAPAGGRRDRGRPRRHPAQYGDAADWVTSVPSARLGDVCAHLAERLAGELGVEHVALIARTRTARPSARWRTPCSRPPTSAGPSPITAPPPPGTGVLLDDQRISGWTLAMVGGQLRRAGARPWSRSCWRRCPSPMPPSGSGAQARPARRPTRGPVARGRESPRRTGRSPTSAAQRSRGRERVVVVVPCLAQRERREPSEVAGLVAVANRRRPKKWHSELIE